jgi:hypothetical protein
VTLPAALARLDGKTFSRFCLFGDSAAVPTPAARGMASGLHFPLALALTLTRPFRPGGKETVAVNLAAGTYVLPIADFNKLEMRNRFTVHDSQNRIFPR